MIYLKKYRKKQFNNPKFQVFNSIHQQSNNNSTQYIYIQHEQSTQIHNDPSIIQQLTSIIIAPSQ